MDNTKEEVLDIHDPIYSQWIDRNEILTVALKRTSTRNGFYNLHHKGYKIGQTCRVNVGSFRGMRFENKETGKHFIMPVVNVIDENGRDAGWIFAELFFA